MNDIIEPFNGIPSLTEQVSPSVVVIPKLNGDIRLCISMCHVNEAIIRERHSILTTEEVLFEMNSTAVFSFKS